MQTAKAGSKASVGPTNPLKIATSPVCKPILTA